MTATITLTALQARRALALARWMAGQSRDKRTRRRCRDLAYSIAVAVSDTEARVLAERLEARRRGWRAATARYRNARPPAPGRPCSDCGRERVRHEPGRCWECYVARRRRAS